MSDLRVGLEIEYPLHSSGDPWKVRGERSNRLLDRVRDGTWPLSGRPTRDGTVGLEIVSDVLSTGEAADWYVESLDYVSEEYGERYVPAGIMSGGNTAGLHTHMSEIDTQKARMLYEWSQEPWMQVFVCTSVTEDEAPTYRVFRSNYCNMEFDENRYSVVNHRGGGHWEWRLPEPMGREHIHLMMEFLDKFKESPETAKDYAMRQVEMSDDITSIRRAQAIGTEILKRLSVVRDPHPRTRGFFQEVKMANNLPYIHRVDIGDDSYYAFHSTLDEEFEVAGVQFDSDTILNAEDLSTINNPEVRSGIDSAIQNWQDTSTNPETMEYLREVVHKKGSGSSTGTAQAL